MANEFEAMMIKHSFDVAACPGKIIIDADDISALLKQSLAEMRTEKSGTAGDQNAFYHCAHQNVPKG